MLGEDHGEWWKTEANYQLGKVTGSNQLFILKNINILERIGFVSLYIKTV